jgi:hypothetical protein
MTRNDHRAVGVEIPRTTAAVLGLDVATTFSSPALVNHCQRSFVFAASLGDIEKLSVETEVLYVAAMLHDLGLESAFDNAKLAFEVAGGHVAWVFAAGAGWPPRGGPESRRSFVLRFAHDPRVPFENNLAEHDIRISTRSRRSAGAEVVGATAGDPGPLRRLSLRQKEARQWMRMRFALIARTA